MNVFGTIDDSYTERHGAYGVALRGREVLIELGKRGHFLPGGGLDEGETPEEALAREFLEETGYELASFTLIDTAVEYKDERKKVYYFYRVELGTKGEPTYPDGHMAPVEWLSLEDALAGMYLEGQRWAIEEAFRRIS